MPGEGDFSLGEPSGEGEDGSEADEELGEEREAELMRESVDAGLGFFGWRSGEGYERGSADRNLSSFFDHLPDTSRPWLRPSCLGDD